MIFSKWRALMEEEVWKCHPVYDSSSAWYNDTPVTLQGNEAGFHLFWIMWREDLFLSLPKLFKWNVIHLFTMHSDNNNFYPLWKLKLVFLNPPLTCRSEKKLWLGVFTSIFHHTSDSAAGCDRLSVKVNKYTIKEHTSVFWGKLFCSLQLRLELGLHKGWELGF